MQNKYKMSENEIELLENKSTKTAHHLTDQALILIIYPLKTLVTLITRVALEPF